MGICSMKNLQLYNFQNFSIHQFNSLDSTNSYAYDLAEQRQIFNYTVIWALQQNNGRGRLNRQWQSPLGNLYFSVVLQPKITQNSLIQIHDIPQISFIANCALKNTIAKLLKDYNINTNLQNKWPNDLLIDGNKVAGILLESKITNHDCQFVILGIGVNITSNPIKTLFPATNLHQYSTNFTTQNLLENFLTQFDNLYKNWGQFGFSNFSHLWNDNAYKINQNININIGNKIIEGQFLGIDNQGLALVKEQNILRKISYGEVC